MGETYHGQITIYGFPTDWLKLTPRTGYGGTEYQDTELGLDALGDCCDRLMYREQASALDALRAQLHEVDREHGVVYSFTAGAGAFGALTIEAPDLSYGIEQLQGLRSALRELGAAYEGQDTGKYDIDGVWAGWRPGWEREQESASTEDGRVLGKAEAEALIADAVRAGLRAGEHAAAYHRLTKALRAHFDPLAGVKDEPSPLVTFAEVAAAPPPGEKAVRVIATGPDGEPLGSWTTTESGEHIIDDEQQRKREGDARDAAEDMPVEDDRDEEGGR